MSPRAELEALLAALEAKCEAATALTALVKAARIMLKYADAGDHVLYDVLAELRPLAAMVEFPLEEKKCNTLA